MYKTPLQCSDMAEHSSRYMTGRDADVAEGITGLHVPDHQFSLTTELTLCGQRNLKGNSSWTQRLDL